MELNLVSQLFVKEAGWQLCPKGVLPVETVDEHGIHIYGTLRITTNAADQYAKSQQRQNEYIATDICDYDMILEDP